RTHTVHTHTQRTHRVRCACHTQSPFRDSEGKRRGWSSVTPTVNLHCLTLTLTLTLTQSLSLTPNPNPNLNPKPNRPQQHRETISMVTSVVAQGFLQTVHKTVEVFQNSTCRGPHGEVPFHTFLQTNLSSTV
ncbi:hypothetical protein ANANG_G00201010, partial [Anguilla anguilla]